MWWLELKNITGKAQQIKYKAPCPGATKLSSKSRMELSSRNHSHQMQGHKPALLPDLDSFIQEPGVLCAKAFAVSARRRLAVSHEASAALGKREACRAGWARPVHPHPGASRTHWPLPLPHPPGPRPGLCHLLPKPPPRGPTSTALGWQPSPALAMGSWAKASSTPQASRP